MLQPAIRVTRLSKQFGATRALDHVDFSLDFGEVHALVGENGAGKSTLIRILGGVHRADSGSIEIAGEPRVFSSPHDAIEAGIVTIPQELRMVPALSIAENIALGSLPMTRRFGVLPSIDRKRMREEAKRYLDQLNFTADLDRPVQSLSFAERQLVAIAKALRLKCRIFILDEPTAALEDREIERLFGVLERMKKNGTAIIYISHRLDEIRDLADRCTVLRDGKLVAVRARGSFHHRRSDRGHDRQDGAGTSRRTRGARPDADRGNRASAPTAWRCAQGETIGLAGLLGSGTRPDRAPPVRRRRRARANPPRRWPQRAAVEALRRDRGRYRLRAGRARARPRDESVGARQYPAAEPQARQQPVLDRPRQGRSSSCAA